MNILLLKSSLRYFKSHPLQTFLSILGIAVGIAVSSGIDLANKSTLNAFKYSMETITGKAVGHLTGSEITSSEYFSLRKKGFKEISPIIEAPVKIKNRTYILFATDPFSFSGIEKRFSNINYLKDHDISSFISRPDSIVIGRKTAEDLGFLKGDTISLDTGSLKKRLKIIGIMEKEKGSVNYDHILITDISTAQEVLEKYNLISRIDIYNSNDFKKLEKLKIKGMTLIKSSSRSSTTEQMVEAFQLNLSALSLLALIVGLFLVYNTMTFSVVRRQQTIGILRSCGVFKREIFLTILIESILLGLPGTAGGLILGVLLGKGLIFLVSQTLNDLYFAMTITSVSLSPIIFVKGFFLGIIASALAGIKPAYEAVNISAAISVKRSTSEKITMKRLPVFTIAGCIMFVITGILISINTKSIIIGYGSFFPLILGFTLVSPLVVIFFVKIFLSFFKQKDFVFKMGINSIKEDLSRTGVAITALAIAVAASVGVGITVKSFRNTVVNWIEQRIGADLYISSPGLISLRNDNPVPGFLLKEVEKISGIKRINYYRDTKIFTKGSEIRVLGLNVGRADEKRFRFMEGGSKKDWLDFRKGEAVFITEPYAMKNMTELGSFLEIPGKNETKKFRVAGIYTDYSSDQGLVSFSYDEFSRFFNTDKLSGISVFIENKDDLEKIRREIIKISKGSELIINSNYEIRRSSLEIFDRTFAVANILQVISIIVAFTGIVSALMSLMLEKTKEIGVLRAIGFYPGEIRKKVYTQTFFMGLISGLLSIPLGHIFSWVLINVVNKRAFGWTLDFSFSWAVIFQALFVSIAAALAAGIFPAFKMSEISPALALREE